MKIILIKDDKKLGSKNSVIEVKDGYGRYLINTQKIALRATEANLKKLALDIKKTEEVDKAIRQLANKIKNDIENDKFIIDISYNKESQQLNGSITKNDVLEAIKKKYTIYNFDAASFIDFPKTHLAQMYKAKLRLYKDIIVNVEFGVDL